MVMSCLHLVQRHCILVLKEDIMLDKLSIKWWIQVTGKDLKVIKSDGMISMNNVERMAGGVVCEGLEGGVNVVYSQK